MNQSENPVSNKKTEKGFCHNAQKSFDALYKNYL